MTIFAWSDLSDGQVLAFRPSIDVLDFGFSPSPSQIVLTLPSATSTRFSFDGKSVTLSGLALDQIVADHDALQTDSANLKFFSLGGIVVGDNSTAKNDGANNVITGVGFSNQLFGLGGNDTLTGGYGADVLDGGLGNDILNGDPDPVGNISAQDTASYAFAPAAVFVDLNTTGPQNTRGAGTDTLIDIEHLVGSAFDDRLTGNAGDNVLEGGKGNDVLNGAAGFDLATYLSASITAGVTVNLALTGRQATGGAGVDTLRAIEAVSGTRFADKLTGDAVHNDLFGNRGNDVLSGADGDDLLNGGAGNDTLNGGKGKDTLLGGPGNDFMDGGNGIDVASYAGAVAGVRVSLAVSSLQDTRGAGSDKLLHIENLLGSDFDDKLTGNSSANSLLGGFGKDTLIGNAGNDILTGGRAALNSSNLIITSTDGDSMFGGAGNDLYEVTATTTQIGIALPGFTTVTTGTGFTPDKVIEAAGGGVDTVETFVSYALPANVENLVLKTTASSGFGNALANVISGNSDGNSLGGGGGNDTLKGGGGNDNLNGAAGNDVLRGQAGADFLTGGSGADRFDFDAVRESQITAATRDRVTDFSHAQHDLIDLLDIDANAGLAGNNAFQFIGTAAFNSVNASGQLRFDAAHHMLLGSTDADTSPEFSLSFSTSISSLVAADIVL